MLFSVHELEQRRIEFNEEFSPGDIDFGGDLRQRELLQASGRAELIHEHRGHSHVVEDIRIVGRFATSIEVLCARCLEPVAHAVSREFDLLYRPTGVDRRGDEVSIHQAETEISYYEGEGVLLEDVLREQVLLALPIRTVCREDCKGLCPKCGANRNGAECQCGDTGEDQRWAALKSRKNPGE
ncbi:MAG: DUF177 domain-containing protein [Acidobacteria bacterium]|nr:DUF177 domain-containing protein [Acidobacteriota bacterium]